MRAAGPGSSIAFHRRFPDHHPFRDAELGALRKAAGPLPLVTTGKDAVRVGGRLAPPWRILAVEMEFLAGEETIGEAKAFLSRAREILERQRMRQAHLPG